MKTGGRRKGNAWRGRGKIKKEHGQRNHRSFKEGVVNNAKVYSEAGYTDWLASAVSGNGVVTGDFGRGSGSCSYEGRSQEIGSREE